MNSPEANIQMVQKANRARERALAATPHDWSEFRSCFDPNYSEYGAWKINSVDDFIQRVEEAWDKLAMQVKIADIFAAADGRVVQRAEVSGVHQKEAFGFPPTGKTLHWEAVEIFEFNSEGKILKMRYFTDLIQLLAQLGFQIPAEHTRF